MKVNRRGITRIVFEFKNVVIKVPNPSYSWLHFLNGLIANINEGQTWRYSKYRAEVKELLCPIVFISWGGWMLIMKKADVERHYKEISTLPELPNDWDGLRNWRNEYYKKWIDSGLGGDDKCDNYGYYNDRLVKIDYA